MAAQNIAELDIAKLDPCAICQTKYGEVNDSDVIEIPVLLPCHHILGNACMASWLSTENAGRSCPVCRSTLQYRQCKHTVKPRPLDHSHLQNPDPKLCLTYAYGEIAPKDMRNVIPDFCAWPFHCEVFQARLLVWERAERNAVSLLQGMQHRPEDAERIAEWMEFLVDRRDAEEEARIREREHFLDLTEVLGRW